MFENETEKQKLNTQLLGYAEEALPVYDISEAEVVRRQFFSHMKENMMTIRPNGVQFNTSCIARFEDVTHVLMMVDWEQGFFIIKPADPDDKDSQRWCTDKRKPRLIRGAAFSERLYRRLGWCKGKFYKICGTPAKQKDSDELIMVFMLKDAEEYSMTKKSRESAGVDDSEISPEDLIKLEEDEQRKIAEKAERDAAKAAGEPVRKRRRKNDHFPDDWEDNMGDRYDQYQSRIEFPHLPENGAEAETMGLSLFAAEQEEGNGANG